MNNSGSGGRANSGPDDDDDVQVGGSRTFPLFGLEDLILHPHLFPWYQFWLGGLYHRRRPLASPPSQFLAPYTVHFSRQHSHAMRESGLEDLILVQPVKLAKAVG